MISKLKAELLQAQKDKNVPRIAEIMASIKQEMAARYADRQKPADESSPWKEGKIKWPTIQEDNQTY